MASTAGEKQLHREQSDSSEAVIIDDKQYRSKDAREKTTSVEDDDNDFPSKKILLPAMAALYLTCFLIAIDRTILGTAVPAIANDFQSFGDISWYEAGFLLPLCMLQLSFGRVYTFYSPKWIIIVQTALFEIGSIVSAAAPNSKALIVGRVITGAGGAGLMSGSMIIVNTLVPLASRPKWAGGFGAVFGVASILGPLLGGYLTAITWRWCFWINVPVGGVALIVLILCVPNRPPALKAADTFTGKLKQLDPIGFLLIAPAVVCLLFALQWGGVQYPWNDGRLVALFVVFGVLLTAFVGVQIWKGDDATVPPKILGQRSIFFGTFAALTIGSALVIYPFYLPIWFQVVQAKTPQSSGLSLLPLLLSNVLLVILTGILTSAIGYYTPFLIIGGAIMIVGSALITTWTVDISTGKWIGYQIVLGIGLGMTLQMPQVAAQRVLPKEEVSIGLTFLTFISFLGGTVFVSVCQSLLNNKLSSGLAGVLPNFDPNSIANGGATTLRSMVSTKDLPLVLEVYNDSLRPIWYLGLALACLLFLFSFGVEWKSVKGDENKEDREAMPMEL